MEYPTHSRWWLTEDKHTKNKPKFKQKGLIIPIRRTANLRRIHKQIYVANIIFQTMYQFSSVTQLCPTLCDPMNRSLGVWIKHSLLGPHSANKMNTLHLSLRPRTQRPVTSQRAKVLSLKEVLHERLSGLRLLWVRAHGWLRELMPGSPGPIRPSWTPHHPGSQGASCPI